MVQLRLDLGGRTRSHGSCHTPDIALFPQRGRGYCVQNSWNRTGTFRVESIWKKPPVLKNLETVDDEETINEEYSGAYSYAVTLASRLLMKSRIM